MQIHGIAQSLVPATVSDGQQKQLRVDAFGSPFVRNELYGWLDEGNYFKVCNTTMGTGVAMGIQASFSDTANVLLLMKNGSTTKRIIPHYIRLVCTAAGASTTNSNMAIVLDTANRYSTGGTDLLTNIVNANSGSANATAVDELRWSCTALAAISKRQIARFNLKNQIAPCWTIGDEVIITFGNPGATGQTPFSTSGTNTAGIQSLVIQKNVGPVEIKGQNHCMLVHMWNTANATTAPSWEMEMAWWERD